MSQASYNVVSQEPTTIPMENYAQQQRITPPPTPWCTPRRTKVIIAIVILSILMITLVVAWIIIAKNMVNTILEQQESFINEYQSYHG